MIYLVCSEDGCFKGFYNEDNIQNVLKEEPNLFSILITEEMQKYVMGTLESPSRPLLNLNLILEDKVDKIDNPNYFLSTEKIVNIRKEKIHMITNLKRMCNEFITAGISITLSDGSIKNFTYKIEDQINIRNLIDSEHDEVYYHASGEDMKIYNKKDILTIYESLEDYKNFNLLYVNVLCKWIMQNYTLEDYENNITIDYGYINDDISQMMVSLSKHDSIV